MKYLLLICLFIGATQWCQADPASGPDRSTIQVLGWGTLYYEPATLGPCTVEVTADGFRFTSSQGVVVIKGSEFNGYRLSWGKEFLTVDHVHDRLEIRTQDRSWNAQTRNGMLTLTRSIPKDKVVFDRSANAFTIKGAKGTVAVASEYGNLRIQSPLGITTITNQDNKRTFAGPALDRIPYLGRGLFIPFHGVGVFLDIRPLFPMPEIAEYLAWKAVL